MQPLSPLNRVLMDRPLTSNSAWQRWIGLPEGALFKFWNAYLISLPEPFRTFVILIVSSSRAPASPCAGSPRELARRRRACAFPQVNGQLEDGVPHERALSPANTQCNRNADHWFERYITEAALVISTLATTSQTSSM